MYRKKPRNFLLMRLTRETLETTRRRINSTESCRLVEQTNALSGPGTLRKRNDPHTGRTVFTPFRPNKRSREELAEIDAQLMQRANRFGGVYQTAVEEEEPRNPGNGELEPEQAETGTDSTILRGKTLPIVDWSKFNTEGKESHYIQKNLL